MNGKKKSTLEQLLEEREKILNKNPELRRLQDKIDLALENAGEDTETRLITIVKMMVEQLGEELLPTVKKLVEPYENVISLSDRLEKLKKSVEKVDTANNNEESSKKKKIVH